MEVTQIIIDGDGFYSKDDHEFMHSVRQYYGMHIVESRSVMEHWSIKLKPE